MSYATGFAGSTIQALMASAGKIVKEGKSTVFIPNKYLNSLAKTNFPGTIVTATLEAGKTLGKYFKGEIDGVECLTELGEKGTGMLSSVMFSTLGAVGSVAVFGKSAIIGQLVIPIPVIGGLIGGMVGYALSSACYEQLIDALKEEKLAREERIRIEAECLEAIQMIREYRAEVEKVISEYLVDHIKTFHQAFGEIKKALKLDDIDGYIGGTNKIVRKLGKNPLFENFEGFNKLMDGSEPLKL
jgi:hypothetical protein